MGNLSRKRARVAATFLVTFAVVLVAAIVVPAEAYAEGFQGRYWDGSRVVDQWGDVPNPTYLGTNVGDDLWAGWYCADESFSDGDRPTVHGTVNLILRDGVTMHLKDGINVPPGSTLNIYGGLYGTGKLLVERSEVDTAAIGGNDNEGCGEINIYSGIVDVKGGSYNTDGGAGIGGGDEGGGGTVYIYGGTVTAKGGPNAAGIGGGEHGGGGSTTIYGGTVNATGGSDSSEGGAGIGGGWSGSGGTIRILGGHITANGGHDGAGIGGGDSGSGGDIEIRNGTVNANGWDSAAIGGGQHGHGGTIKISGGTVTATGGVTSAAIGGGQGGNGGDITISGGNVTATANTEGAGIGGGDAGGSGGNITITGGTIRATGHDGAGIGGGDNGGSSGTIKITGGEITAIGGSDAAGIGGGYDGACETIEISNCTIKEAKGGSTSNSGGAGIGGGNAHDGGTITISNANVTAQGGSDGAGIGGGDQASGGNITISADSLDYKIKATGGGYGAGIGGGQGGHGGSVTINGGTIEATGASDAAGIGGGEDGNGGTVTITGGKVTATGSPNNANRDGGAGIGGGDLGNGGTVNISGGEVIAKGGEHGAGIGGGDADHNNHGNGGTVTITGDAHVTAQGGHSGAGIGSGEEGLTGGTVTIGTEGSSTGPTVIATGGTFAAGIGSGDAFIQASNANVDVKGADVVIYSGDVTAIGGEDAAGIGGGEGANNGTTKIYGGTVVAKAGTAADNDGGAGIGSGDDCIREKSANRHNTTGGTIEIHGGNVTATGNADGAGIGGGDYGSGGNITITGGIVTANGGAYAAGIGGGEGRGAGSVTITGGYVRATGGSDGENKYGGAGIGGGANISNRTSETNNDSGADQGQAIGEDVINISGNCTVVAQGGANAAGIGGGTAGAPGSVTIAVDENCTVDATGGKHAAGIGGGRGNNGEGQGNRVVNRGVSGNITINSGTVTAIGGKDGGSGIGSGAACGNSSTDTVNVTINGGSIIARAGEITEDSQYDSGVAIGAGGKYFKDEMKNIQLDDDGDFVIEDEDIPSIFKGAITFNGGHIVAQAAHAPESLEDYLDGALNVIGASRDSNVTGGRVDFKGSTVWMWTDGFSDGSATKYSQAVRAGTDGGGAIYFTDDPEHQNVFYVLVPEYGEEYEDEEMRHVGDSYVERVYALTKYDTLKDPNNYGLVVVKPQHEHDFTYTAEGDTITAACSQQSCTLPGHKATLKIKKPLHAKYDDGLTDNGATEATIEDSYLIQGSAAIEYYKTGSDGKPEGDRLDGAPAGAGAYWAQISLGSGENKATAHVAYTIEKAESPARVNGHAGITMPEGSTEPVFIDLEKNITYDETKEDYDPGDVEPTYEITGDANGCTVVGSVLFTSNTTKEGTVTVKVHVPGDSNYKDFDSTINVRISVKPLRGVIAGDFSGSLLGGDVEATYGQEEPVYVWAKTDNPTSEDVWSMEVKDGYEDFIEVDEGDVEVGEDDVNVRFPSIKIKKAGEAYVVVTVEADGVYAPSSAEVKVTINKAAATVTATNESIDVHGTPEGKYTTEGLVEGDTLTTPPTFTYKRNATPVNPSEVGPGTYTIEPSGADSNDNYTFTYVPGTLTVREGNPAWVKDTASVIVNRNNQEDLNTVNLADNVSMRGATGAVHYEIMGDAKGCELSESGVLTAGTEEGTVYVKVRIDADDNYSALTNPLIAVTIAPKEQQIIDAPQVDVTYGQAGRVSGSVIQPTSDAGAISYAVAEGGEEYIDVDPVTGVLTVKAVPVTGSVIVTVTAAETNTLQETSTPVVVRINKAPLTIRASDITAYVFDGVPDLSNPQPNVDYTVEGFVNGDGLGVLETGPTLTYQKDGAPTIPFTAIVGTYDIVPAGADAGGNYAISYAKGTLTVKDRKRQVITASDVNVTYGDAGMSLGATTNGDGTLSYLVKGDAVSVNANGMLTTYKTGTAYVTITASGTDNYTPAVKEVRVTVNKAQLTVTAKDEQIYAGGTPEGFYDVVGLAGYDQLSTPPTLTYQKDGVEVDPQTAPPGDYDIVPSDADSFGNYTVTYVNGKLTIRGDQTVTASDVAVMYGDTGRYVRGTSNGDGAISYTVKEGAECVDVDAATGEITTKRAGMAIVTVAAAETNTYARASKDVIVTVDRRKATIQADDKSKWVDDANNPALTATVSGVMPGDALAYDLTCEIGSGVGSYPIRVTLDQNVAPNYNYDVTLVDGTFSVTETNMSVSVAVRAEGWQGTYDGQPHGIGVTVTAPMGTDYSVTYGKTAETCDATTSPAQTDVGALTVYYKVTAGNDVVIGSKDIIIEKAPITPSVTIDGWEWGQTPNAPMLGEGSNPGNGAVTYEYAHKGGSDWSAVPPVAYGDYTVLATVPETTNYLGGTATADFSVAAKEATLTFHLDGGMLDGSTDDLVVKASCGDTIKLPGEPSKHGYDFVCWDSLEYWAGADFTVSGDQEFTAVWDRSLAIVGTLSVTANGFSGTYDGEPHGVTVTAEPEDPADATEFDGATVYYSADTELTIENYEQGSTTSPTFTDAGTHTVYYYVVADRFVPASGKIEVAIAKVDATVTAPVPFENLVYDGGYLALVEPGVVEGGTMEYSLDDGKSWSKDVPAAIETGAYAVRYRVTGDDNHKDSDGGVVYARINGKRPTYLATTGAGASWSKYSKEGLAVTFKRYAEGEDKDTALVHFQSVAMDGEQINEGTQFTRAEGDGVIVTLQPAYLNLLPGGSHKLAVTFDDGSAETLIIIVDVPKPATFSDVPAGAWFYDVVYRAVSLGFFSGYPDGRFGSVDRITRAQVTVALWNMAGHPAPGANAKRFSDVMERMYYTDAIAWASGAGVVSGYADGRFGPDDPVTREQLAAMLANYARKIAGKPTNGSAADFQAMKDASKVSGWAVSSVGWCFQQHIISGTADGYVNPQGDATRAEAAKMFVMLHDLL